MKGLLNYFFIIISIVIFFYGYSDFNYNLMLIAIMIEIINNIIYSISNIKKRIVFFFFNISMFTFLVGKYFFEMLDKKEWWNGFDSNIIRHTLLCVFISLTFLLVGAFIQQNIRSYNKSKLCYRNNKNYKIRQISSLMYVITCFFAFLVVAEKVVFVQNNSYLEFYIEYQSRLPILFRKIAQTNQIFLYIYLATMPTKRQAKPYILIYIIYLLITLLVGERGTLVVGIFTIVIYAIFRDMNEFDKNELWIGKKEKILMITSLPFFIVFLSIFNLLRSNIEISNFSFWNELINFFKAQGGSINVISYGKVFEDNLPTTNISYTFGPIISYFTRGTFARIFTGLDILKGNSIEMALYGNNFASTITYLVNSNAYLSGFGLGTQYIAEVYYDLGYIGVIIFNIILGYILMWIPTVAMRKWWSFPIGMSLCSSLLFMPRDSALSFISIFMSVTTWLPIISVLIYYKFITRKNQ